MTRRYDYTRLSMLPQRVAYAVDWRDDDDEHTGDPTFCFRGTNVLVLRQVFDFLVPLNGNGVARSYAVDYEHDVRFRQGKGYVRHYVVLHGYNSHFCELPSLCLLVESVFKRTVQCTITRMSIDKFLNV